MDELTELQTAIDYANSIATGLGVDEAAINLQTAEIGSRNSGLRDDYEISMLRTLLLEAAACHDDVCDQEECCQCTHLREGVALVAGALRFDLVQALDGRLAYKPARRTQRIDRPHYPDR